MSMNEYIGHEDDIYRGEDDQQGLQSTVSSASSSSSKSSSTSSIVAGGRIGAIAAKLELAISRWAKNVRRNASMSSNSSSTSSLSSRTTTTRSQLSRKRRFSRAASISSEREIALRITRLKALRESRQVCRGFTLYLPPSIIPRLPYPLPDLRNPTTSSISNAIPHITSTTYLSDLLTQLEAVIRIPGKHRRQHHRSRETKLLQGTHNFPLHSRPLSLDGFVLRSNPTTRGRKGKQHEMMLKPAKIPEEPQIKRQAWFLDVSSPTWADLQAIGKILHIHPLTLEDILQQDPREKVEDFPNLGYYFISFRTIESQATRERAHREAGLPDSIVTSQGLDEGSIGETNVYLTIFIDGICCFHYTDVSEHTDRIRNMMENNVNMTSDWIGHTILDSIVDSFFPILDEIDQEVGAIDRTVTETASSAMQDTGSITRIPLTVPGPDEQQHTEKPFETELAFSEKKTPTIRLPSYRTHFASPRLSISLLFRRVRRHFHRFWRKFQAKADNPSTTQSTLRRMARVKKLIAVLGRLLSSKLDLMTGIKKRLIKAIESKIEGTTHQQTPEEVEIAIYMTDIQDHILALQLSLAHNERMLSHSHPAYMSNLRSELEMTKSGIDIKVLYLSTATLIVLCIQTLTGIFSMNVTVPHNEREPKGKYIGFSLVLTGAVVITASILGLVRRWWKRAEQRRSRSL